MNILPRLTMAATLLRAPLAENRRGDDARDWSEATETEIEPGVAFWQETEAEDNDGREAEESDGWMVFPAGLDVKASDRVVLPAEGETYDVVGRPRKMRSFTRTEFVLGRIRLVEG